jgi:hypothetical protein
LSKGWPELWEWGTKKPAGLAPCGLSGLHQSTLVIGDGEFWWSRRELNPRPKFLHSQLKYEKKTTYVFFSIRYLKAADKL